MKRFLTNESISLIDLFKNPLESVEAISIKSNSEAEREIEAIEKQTEERSDWDQKFNAIKRCMSLIKGGAMEYSGFDLNLIIPNAAQTVTDLRSTLVKWGAMFACATSGVMGAKFVPYIDIYIPNLFKQATHGTAIISKSCHYAITQIVLNCPSRKTARAILDKVNDKSAARRLIVAESLMIMSNIWPHNIFTPVKSDINNAITKLKKDASVEVRNVFKEGASWSPDVSLPRSMSVTVPQSAEHSRIRLAKHGGTPRERIGRTESKIPRTERRAPKSIQPLITAALVKPQNEEEANLYITQLSKQLESGIPAVKRRLVKSIETVFPSAVDIVPQNKDLQEIIPKLLTKYKEEMKDCICDVLVSMELDENITKTAIATYGFDELVSYFNNNTDAVIFIIFVNNNFPEFIKESSLPTIKSVLDKDHEKDANTETLEKIVEKLTPSASSVIKNVLSAVKGGKFGKTELKSLKELKDKDIEDEFNNNKKLPKMIKAGGDVTYFTLTFIETLMKEWPNLSLISSLKALISILSDEKSLFAPMAERIIIKMLSNIDVGKEILPYIKKDNNSAFAAVSLLFNLLSEASDKKIKDLSKTVPSALLPLLNSKSVSIRRCTIMCFVYFKKACKKELKPVLAELNESDKLLIDYFAKNYD